VATPNLLSLLGLGAAIRGLADYLRRWGLGLDKRTWEAETRRAEAEAVRAEAEAVKSSEEGKRIALENLAMALEIAGQSGLPTAELGTEAAQSALALLADSVSRKRILSVRHAVIRPEFIELRLPGTDSDVTT
jgi:hypothetical protein